MAHTASKEITFEVGDLVTWQNPDHLIIKGYGPGPFQVVKVIFVPKNRYSCGALVGNPWHHATLCEFCGGQTMRESVGHSQQVVIQEKGRNHYEQ